MSSDASSDGPVHDVQPILAKIDDSFPNGFPELSELHTELVAHWMQARRPTLSQLQQEGRTAQARRALTEVAQREHREAVVKFNRDRHRRTREADSSRRRNTGETGNVIQAKDQSGKRDAQTYAEKVEVVQGDKVIGQIGRLYPIPGESPEAFRRAQLSAALCAIDRYRAALLEERRSSTSWVATELQKKADRDMATRFVYLAKAWECEIWPGTLPHVDGRTFVREDALRDLDALRGRLEAELAAPGTPTAAQLDEEKRDDLTPTESAVLKIIASQKVGTGLTGKEIVTALKRKGMTLSETSLRRNIIPKLKKYHGVINCKSAGGYLIPRRSSM